VITVADFPRYANLARLVFVHACRRIIEIGVFNGAHGLQMINAAKELYEPGDIYYLGFDLFEDINLEILKSEYSKASPPMEDVWNHLHKTGANVSLFKGDTKNTLPAFIPHVDGVDLIFVDGGHSEETIASDWHNIKQILTPDTVVIFDDYYIDAGDVMDGLGCNALIDSLDRTQYNVEFLEPVDSFVKAWGVLRIQMVKVMLNG